jgi:hypothetical protein
MPKTEAGLPLTSMVRRTSLSTVGDGAGLCAPAGETELAAMAEARKLRRVSMRPPRLSVRDYRLSGTEPEDPAKRAEGIRLPAFLGIRRAAQSQDCSPAAMP